MRILIIADHLLSRELNQNGILAEMSYKLKAMIECQCSFNEEEISFFDKVVVWSHPTDANDYKQLLAKIRPEAHHISFPKTINYRCFDSSSSMFWNGLKNQTKEQPDYHCPSKYEKSLRTQLKILLQNINPP